MKRIAILALTLGLASCGINNNSAPLPESAGTQVPNPVSEDAITAQARKNTTNQNLYLLNSTGIGLSIGQMKKYLEGKADIDDKKLDHELNKIFRDVLVDPANRHQQDISTQQLYPYSTLIPEEAVQMNSYERQLCDESAWRCLNFLDAGAIASSQSGADMSWQDYGINNEKDAFRHSYWNAVMTLSIGYAAAQAFADAHEKGSPTQVQGGVGQQMDFHNNAVGRNVANNLPNTDRCNGGARIALHKEMSNGRLRIVKRNSFLEKVDEKVGNTRYLVYSNAWATTWPTSYKNLINRAVGCYI